MCHKISWWYYRCRRFGNTQLLRKKKEIPPKHSCEYFNNPFLPDITIHYWLLWHFFYSSVSIIWLVIDQRLEIIDKNTFPERIVLLTTLLNSFAYGPFRSSYWFNLDKIDQILVVQTCVTIWHLEIQCFTYLS